MFALSRTTREMGSGFVHTFRRCPYAGRARGDNEEKLE
jgi:hypothetical protein